MNAKARAKIATVAGACLLVAALLVIAGCQAQQEKVTTSSKNVQVTIKNLRFNPPKLVVTPGTTVTWTNRDETVHTISPDATSGPTFFKESKFLNPGDTFKHKFESAGEYKYHCNIHPYLQGEVIVRNQ